MSQLSHQFIDLLRAVLAGSATLDDVLDWLEDTVQPVFDLQDREPWLAETTGHVWAAITTLQDGYRSRRDVDDLIRELLATAPAEPVAPAALHPAS